MEEDGVARVRSALIGVIFVVWGVTFGVVGLGSDGLTAICSGEEPTVDVAGYTWARDHTNDCAWTLYSGTFPVRNKAPDSLYYANNLIPPDTAPLLHTWQIVALLIAVGSTGVLGIAHERLKHRHEDAVLVTVG
jgi:hypothetical protein